MGMDEILRHPLTLVVLNILIVPAVGAWVRGGISSQIALALVPITTELREIQGKLADLKIEQTRVAQEIKDHTTSDHREFESIRADLRERETRIGGWLQKGGFTS